MIATQTTTQQCGGALVVNARIPELAPHEGSWVVTRRNGTVIGEFFDRANVERFNPETCRIETIGAHLARVNREIRDAS